MLNQRWICQLIHNNVNDMNTRLYTDLHYVEPVRLEIIKLHKVPVIYEIYEIFVFKAWSHVKRINASGPDD